MEKKKVLKAFIIILIMILLIFLINIGRKAYVLLTYSRESKEYSKVTNFYRKMKEEGDVTSEYWRKGNIALYKRVSKEGTRIIYLRENNNWIIVDTVDENKNAKKVATKLANENDLDFISLDETATLYTANWWEAIKVAFLTQITTEQVEGVDCYKIHLSDNNQIYVSKSNYLTIRETNGTLDTGIIEYKINQVTDEQVALPNLEGFKIIEDI